MVVYRIALFCPELVTHVFSVCTPYFAPNKDFIPMDDFIARLPFFGYQKVFASGEVEKVIKTKADIRQFLTCLYGGATPKGEFGFDPMTGPVFDRFPDLQLPYIVSEEV